MNKTTILVIAFLVISTLLLVSISTLQPKSSKAIFIRANGNVDPMSATIRRIGNTYILTRNITGTIIVQKDNIEIDGKGYSLNGNGSGIGIELLNRSNVTIENMQISNFYRGIYLSTSTHNNISKCIISNNTRGIELSDNSRNNSISGNIFRINSEQSILIQNSSQNSIAENILTGKYSGIGISLLFSSNNNNVLGNEISYTGASIRMVEGSENVIHSNIITYSHYGIQTIEVSDNKFIENQIKNNEYGIYSTFKAKHLIYHNDFINNTIQAISGPSSISEWDNGEEGNYWSDYKTRYSSAKEKYGLGIWDLPYEVSEDNVDRYPLLESFS